MGKLKEFLKRKDVVFSAHRYGIDAMGAMAQGLFASLLIGTIIKTLGEQIGLQFLVDAGTFAQSVAGPAMAASIGYALHTPPLVLFSLFWKRMTRAGAIAGMLSGGGMVFIWKLVIKPLGGIFGIYELLPAFIVSSIFIIAVSLLTNAPSKEIQDEFERVKKGA